MMLSIALFAASAQIHGTDIPEHFRNRNVGAYRRCLRVEVNAANQDWSGPDPAAPTVVQFGQLATYCGAERSLALSSLRDLIQTRHPDWSSEQVAEAAEFVLTGFDLEMMNEARRPISDGVHEPLRERF